MKNDTQQTHLKDLGGFNFHQESFHVVVSERLRNQYFFLMACQRNQLLASMQFVLLEQLTSLCSDERGTLKKSSYI